MYTKYIFLFKVLVSVHIMSFWYVQWLQRIIYKPITICCTFDHQHIRYTGPDGAVANELVGTGFASQRMTKKIVANISYSYKVNINNIDIFKNKIFMQ